ncbi:MAG: 6-bladed beta-propeller [Bacteroidales bacterium]
MNFKSLIIAILIGAIVLLTGCKKTDTSDLISFDIENTKAVTIDFNDVFVIDRIVVLEETDASLVSHIIKVECYNNDFYISDNRHGIVLRFDENGKFLNKIGSLGNGPGEIGRLSSFKIDEKHICLLDYMKVVKYKLDGTFIEEFDKRFFTIDFDFRDSEYMFYNMNVPAFDQFIKIDSSHSVIESFSPLRKSPRVEGVTGRDYLFYYKDDYYFTYPYSDTIYRLTDTISTAFLSYGFGYSKFTDFPGLLNRTADINLSDISYSFRDFMTDNYLISSLVINGQERLLIYNRESGNNILIDSIAGGPDLLNSSSLQDFSDNRIMCWTYSPIKRDETFMQILKDVKTNDNDILILTKLKKTKI